MLSKALPISLLTHVAGHIQKGAHRKTGIRLSSSKHWNSVVGLEVHAQLATKSKLFSASGTEFTAPVNTNVSLFDAAMPGTLPVLNKKCVEYAVISSLALSCQLNPVSTFDRKHYFYSDLPTGYQITQQRQPIAKDGVLNFYVFTPGVHKVPYKKSSKIKQLQLEQDSGKSLHDSVSKKSFIDLNRAGIPLIEIVFEPDLSDGEEAAALVKELAMILEELGTCSSKMEEGALRVDANVSVHKPGSCFGVRTEIKNIGSVRGVANAVKYEIQRQIKVLESGGKVVNETRGWDPIQKETISLRDKEEKQDYRYMPEPNLPPLRLRISDEEVPLDKYVLDVRNWKEKLPELPESRREKLLEMYGLNELETITLVNQERLNRYFDEILKEKKDRDPKKTCNILIIELLAALYRHKIDIENCTLSASCLGEIVDLIQSESINLESCRKILDKKILGSPLTPSQIVEEDGLTQISDPVEIEKLCMNAMKNHPKEVSMYRKGKTRVFQVFMIDIFTASCERVNTKRASKRMKELLDSDSN